VKESRSWCILLLPHPSESIGRIYSLSRGTVKAWIHRRDWQIGGSLTVLQHWNFFGRGTWREWNAREVGIHPTAQGPRGNFHCNSMAAMPFEEEAGAGVRVGPEKVDTSITPEGRLLGIENTTKREAISGRHCMVTKGKREEFRERLW